MRIPRHRALAILTKCVGNEIWSVSHCRDAGVPEVWIEELSDVFESGFKTDSQTIYVGNDVTNLCDIVLDHVIDGSTLV